MLLLDPCVFDTVGISGNMVDVEAVELDCERKIWRLGIIPLQSIIMGIREGRI